MSVTNLIFFLLYLFISHPPPKENNLLKLLHTIFPHLKQAHDLIVTHCGCSPKRITHMQYYKLNKIGEYEIKSGKFQILPAQVQIFSQIPTLRVRA